MAVDAATRRIVMANDVMSRLVDYSPAELLTMGPADLLTPGDDTRLVLAYEHLTPETFSRREWMGRRRDGAQLPVGVTSMPMLVDGRLVVQIIVHDLADEAPDAGQRTLLALANDRLATTVDYDEMIQAITTLIVPQIADRCTIDLLDGTGNLTRAADTEPAITPGTASATDDTTPSAEASSFELRAHGRDLGSLTMYRTLPRTWRPDARSVAIALARRAAQAIYTALLWQTAQRELSRRAAIHRISRAFAESEPGSDRVMQMLLDEAMAMLGGDHGGIAMWDAPSRRLIQVHCSTGRSNGMPLDLEDSLSGAAALNQRPMISNDYQSEYGKATPGGRFGAHAGIAAPLFHEGRLLGVLSVGTRTPGKRFTPDDAEALDLLAGIAASMFGALERAQLQAVSLAARELAHRLNNELALAIGAIDMLRHEPSMSNELHELIEGAAEGLDRVVEQLEQLQQLVRFQTRETPIGPALDLDRSTNPEAGPF